MKCEECLLLEASVLCIVCDQALCRSCEENLHKGGKRKSHCRPLVCRHCKNQAVIQCVQCSQVLCNNCVFLHSTHLQRPISAYRKVGVFWDLSTCRPTRPEEVQIVLSEIQDKLGVFEFIKSYGDPWGKWKDVLQAYEVQSIHKPGIKTIESLLLDISICLNQGLTHVFIISAQAQTFTPHLMQLKSNMPGVEFWLSLRIMPLQVQETLTDDIKKEKYSQVDVVVAYLKEEAFKGNVIILLEDCLQAIGSMLKVGIEEVGKLVIAAERAGLVVLSCREFHKKISNFISMKIECGSLDCLTWTLRSLRIDEMLPSEKAIQARMREAFDYKPTPDNWQALIQQARGHSMDSSGFSLFSKSASPMFTFKEIIDPTSGSQILLIYPNGESWQALDNHSKFGDYLHIQSTEEWKEFLSFLESYFAPKGVRRPKKDDEQKAIAGGRYGCAQMIKLNGPPLLRNCSLGRLSYMIQLAINEDLLRYQKTLLVWTTNNYSIVPKAELAKRLQVIKATVLSILEKSPEGVSLAQFPLHLKKKLHFPLNIADLGFAKLKDLLATFPEVAIELRDTNLPFAVLNKPTPSAENILVQISSVLSDNRLGLQDYRIEAKLFEKLGRINWSSYSANCISDFVQTYGKDRFEVIKSRESYVIFKSKKNDFACFYESTKDDPANDRPPTPTSVQSRSSGQLLGHLAKIPPKVEPSYFFESYNDSSTDFSYSMPRYSGRKAQAETGFDINEHSHSHKTLAGRGNPSNWLNPKNFKPPPGFDACK